MVIDDSCGIVVLKMQLAHWEYQSAKAKKVRSKARLLDTSPAPSMNARKSSSTTLLDRH